MRKRNWSHYNKSLVQRGSITFWIDENFLRQNSFFDPTKGRPKVKLTIIHMGWILKTLYRLTFRALEGFFSSILRLMGIKNMKVPHYTLFCKRAREVEGLLPKLSNKRPLEIVIDSSGVKIYGEGEWKTYKHGREKKRRWMKIHVAVDPQSGECIAAKLTDETGADPAQLPALIGQVSKRVKRAYADGAYDTLGCRSCFRQHNIEEIIPPRKGAIIRGEKGMESRNNAIQEIVGLGGCESLWKFLKGYGKRSLVETFFSRLKILFGERLSSKKSNHQWLEVYFRLHSLNKMAKTSNF